MSQLSTQIQGSSWTSVPIARFSHNYCPVGTRTFTWTHINNRNDLQLTLQEVRVVDNIGHERAGLLMKITAGLEILESQELGEMVEIHRAYNPGAGERPVELVTKSPFLAMRYPKAKNMVQRIQMKFHSGDTFSRALQVLSGLGLPTSDRSGTSSISATTVGSYDFPVIHRSNDQSTSVISNLYAANSNSVKLSPVENISRPLTATPTLLAPRPPSSLKDCTSPYSPALGSSGLSSQHFSQSSPLAEVFKIPVRPVSAISEGARSVSMISPSSVPSTGTLDKTSMFSQTRRESTSVSESHQPSIYLSQLHKESIGRSSPFQPSPHFIQARPLSGADMAPRVPYTQELSPNESHKPLRPSSASSHFTPLQRTPMAIGLSTEDPFSDSPFPVTVLAKIFDDTIPPRRELPFKRPQSSGSRISTTPIPPPVLRISSGLRPLALKQAKPQEEPKAPIQTTITPKPAPKKRVAQRNSSVKAKVVVKEFIATDTLAKEITTPSTVSMVDEGDSSLAVKSASALTLTRPSSEPVGLVSKAVPPVKKRNAAVQRSPSAEKRTKVTDQSTQTNMPDKLPQVVRSDPKEPELAEPVTPVLPPEAYMSIVDRFVVTHKDRPRPITSARPVEIWEAPGYAEMDEERRLELVNDFLCRSLCNDDFIKLCEDLEHSWRRIGFM